MAYRLPAHLHRNRHGILYFRIAIPFDLQAATGQREIYRSLATANTRQAADAALALTVAFKAVFERLRRVGMSEHEKTAQERLEEFVQLPDLRLRLKNAGMQVALEEQQAQLDRQENEIVNLKERGERDLEIALRTGSPSAAQPTSASKTISETWDGYKAEKIAAKTWKDGEDTAKYDHWPHVRAFINVVGDKPMGTVTADDVDQFQKQTLTNLDGGSPSNRKKRLERAGALFRWAKTKRYITDDFRELFRYPGKVEENHYLKFDQADLVALFESDDYRQHRFKRPSEYWLPVLALFTGARLNELCQLTVRDIGKHEGVDTISILDEEMGKRLKTAASRRIIPIHSTLIALGFLDYVGGVTERLFPELPENKARPGDFTKEPTRKFTEYRRRVGVGTDRFNVETGKWEGRSSKVFHSFRSTLISALRKADVPKDRRTRLAGHEYEDTQDRNYNGGDVLTMFSMSTLKEDIERVQIVLAFTPYRGIS